MMEGSSLLGMIISGVWIACLITLPVLVIIVAARAIRRSVTPQEKEIQRLLGQAVALLEENNRLLNQQITARQPEDRGVDVRPNGGDQ